MKKLTKDQIKLKTDLIDRLGVARANVEVALNAYNDLLDEARTFAQEIESAQTDYQSERSDKWQESEAGDAYQCWMDGWNGWGDLEAFEFDSILDANQGALEDAADEP